MARPDRNRRSKDRRRQILSAASGLMARKAWQAPTMEEVAREAGVSVGTIYNYFRNREHMLVQLRLDAYQQLHASLTSAVESWRSLGFWLTPIARAVIRLAAEQPEALWLILLPGLDDAALDEFPEEARQIQRLSNDIMNLVRRQVEMAQDEGLVREELDADGVTAALAGIVTGLICLSTNRHLIGGTGVSISKFLLSTASILSGGLGNSSSGKAAIPVQGDFPDLHDDPRKALFAAFQRPVWITPALVFRYMPAAFHPEAAKGLDYRYVFEIEGDRGGTWSVCVRDGELTTKEGSIENPSATIRLSEADMAEMAGGSIDPMTLVGEGRLRVEGDLSAALALPRIFSFDELRLGFEEPELERASA